jgi:hypothetical protein
MAHFLDALFCIGDLHTFRFAHAMLAHKKFVVFWSKQLEPVNLYIVWSLNIESAIGTLTKNTLGLNQLIILFLYF